MGNTISSRIQWTNTNVAVSTPNYEVLAEILKTIDRLATDHPIDARTEFKRPLLWTSPSLSVANFNLPQTIFSQTDQAHSAGNTQDAQFPNSATSANQNNNSNAIWQVTNQQRFLFLLKINLLRSNKSIVSSTSTRSDRNPFFNLVQTPLTGGDNSQQSAGKKHNGDGGSFVYVAKVGSFEYLNRILKLAGDHKLKELQEIIQSNRDGIAAILGISPINQQEIQNDELPVYICPLKLETNQKQKEQSQNLYRLSLILNNYDIQLMRSAFKDLEKDRFIGISKVTEELEMLKAFCGKDPKNALQSIDWESDYTFSNGFKAPPWRQVFGEICYIEIRPMDRDHIVVTATREGYFVNKGYATDNKGNQHLNYEKEDEGEQIFKSITGLMKKYSRHFEATIERQEYLYHPEEAEVVLGGALAAEVSNCHDAHNDCAAASDDDHDGGDEGGNGNRKGGEKRQTMIKKKSKNSKKGNRAIEPSLKWRALGLNPEEIGVKPTSSKNKKDGKQSGNAGDKQTKSSTIAPNSLAIRNHEGGRGVQSSQGDGGKKANGGASGGNQKLGQATTYEDEFSESESEISSEEENTEKRQDNSELPAEYYQIQKLVKYLRCGNQTATIIAICSLLDFDLSNEFNQSAIRDVGGLDTIVNLLDTNDPKCKIGALKVLKEISKNVQIRNAISDLDGMQPLIELLKDPNEELKCLAAETIAHCAKNAKNRRAVRKYGGIKKLVRLLKANPGSKEEKVAISGALALATCSKSAKNKEAIQAAGSIPLLANLLESKNESLLIPVVGILQECASDENYRVAIRSSGMIKFLVENLSSKNEELQTHCASAIFKCAEDNDTRNLVRQYEGLTPIVNLLDNVANRELLVAATGAVWKCAQNLENVTALNKLNTIKRLVGLMENQPEDVLVNVVGALGACAKSVEGRQAIRESGGITPLVNLLTGTNQALLVNVTTAVGESALDSDSMAIIDRLDGVRLLWSLLKSSNPHVQASAAWAISPCIEHAKDAGEMVRSFVGGLELIVSLLKSENAEVLASVCAAIANIARDEENLAVITDHGVVPMLAKLTNTRNDKLRKHLSEAIARCCHWGNNRVAFGTAGAVAPLVKYLKSPDEQVHRSTARALHQLSMDPDNCITMHENGVVQLLLGMVGSSDAALQEAAAGTIGNIRRLALASEKAALQINPI